MERQLKPDRIEKIKSYVHELRHNMVMDKPSVDLLEKWLFKKLKFLRLKAERVEFYNEILKLKKPRILDVYYSYSIKSFFTDIQDLLDDENDSPPKIVVPLTFEGLFKDRDNAKEVKKLFESFGYTKNGEWVGLTDDKTELLSAYYVLRPLFKSGLKVTPTAKIFYSEFGLSSEHMNDRTYRKYPNENEKYKEFERIFFPLLTPSIKNH